MVQGAAMRLWEGGGTLRERLDEDDGITSRLSREELDAAFDLDVQLRHLDGVFARVFQEDNA